MSLTGGTVNVSYPFTGSNVSGYTSHTGTSATMAGVAGGLQTSLGGVKNITANSSWTLGTTWQALGVPAGGYVVGVENCSIQSECTAATSVGATNSSGPVTIVDGGHTIVASPGRNFSAIDGSPVTTSGGLTFLGLPAADSITITISNTLSTANSTSAALTLLQIQLAFTIIWTTEPVGQNCGVSGVT